MANNRMSLACGICGEKKMFTKYYPSTGWYFECIQKDPPGVKLFQANTQEQWEHAYNSETREQAFSEWMREHAHEKLGTFKGPTHFTLEYETA